MILSMGGGVLCSVGVMGCYPLVPAYFAALYLEQVRGPMLLGMMYIGMFLFMPATAVVKYAVALLVILVIIRLIEWANEGCPTIMAGFMAAVSTVILSFAGGLLELRNQPRMSAVILEGVFIFGAVILLNRMAHIVVTWEMARRKNRSGRRRSGCSGTRNPFRGYPESSTPWAQSAILIRQMSWGRFKMS